MLNTQRKNGYFIIEDDPVLSVAEQFRSDTLLYRTKMCEWLKKIGAESCRINFGGKPFCLKFPKGEVPELFKKPDKYGCVEPYVKNKKWVEILDNAPVEPNPDKYLHDVIGCPHSISYEYEGGRGVSRICGYSLNLYSLGWFSKDSPIVVVMPDVKAEVEDFYKTKKEYGYKNAKITNDVEQYSIPEGLNQILKEEWDLIVAKHKEKQNEE